MRGVRGLLKSFSLTQNRRSARSLSLKEHFSAYLRGFSDRARSGHCRLSAGHPVVMGAEWRVTGAVCLMTGKGPVTKEAYLRTL